MTLAKCKESVFVCVCVRVCDLYVHGFREKQLNRTSSRDKSIMHMQRSIPIY